MAAADASEKPYKNLAYRVTFGIFDSTGAIQTGAATPDSEISKDGGTFIDCSNEATEIATNSGMYYLDLTATEMDADTVAIIVKSGDQITTPIVLYPSKEVVERGTAQAGSTSSTLVLRASPRLTGDDVYNGCLVRVVDGTGTGQIRLVTDYVTSTDTATVHRDWTTTPDNTSVYEIVGNVLTSQAFPTNFESIVVDGVTGAVDCNLEEIQDSTTPVDNMADDYDGTGYAKSASSIGTVDAIAATGIDGILDEVVEAQGSITLRQACSLMVAVLMGRVSISGDTVTFSTPNNSATRATVVTDSSDQRTSVTLSP